MIPNLITQFRNERDEEKFVCYVCLGGHGLAEVTILINEGIFSCEESFTLGRYVYRIPRYSNESHCALCEKELPKE